TRNPFDLGETMEVLSPGQENRTFRISEIKNENGEYLEISRQPMKELRLKVPFAVRPDDILRRSREDDH
ncbi:MAG: U32 family peptidase C-terminal domain-containing protein, partial [Solobacterium sp.]|nr:U32 family peptidase C-terminal domain-containing protein [Solobacterium sp.]